MNKSVFFVAIFIWLLLPDLSHAEKRAEKGRASEGEFPPGMKTQGEPLEREIRWTAYYKTTTEPSTEAEGRKVIFTCRDDRESIFWITPESFEAANLQSLAAFRDDEGKQRYGFRMDEGKFTELPKGSMGMGNRSNPLVPLIHVSADQEAIPYGSMIQIVESEALHLAGGETFAGYLWVGDTGSAVKGDHLDLFTGRKELFTSFVETAPETILTKIYKIPTLDEEYNPGLLSGLAKILEKADYLESDSEFTEEEVEVALRAFQKDEPYIPEAEYGNARAATTLWFLSQIVVNDSSK